MHNELRIYTFTVKLSSFVFDSEYTERTVIHLYLHVLTT